MFPTGFYRRIDGSIMIQNGTRMGTDMPNILTLPLDRRDPSHELVTQKLELLAGKRLSEDVGNLFRSRYVLNRDKLSLDIAAEMV